ncbi:MAG TPA: neutral/alkaline non-lysosomal ceramidase N-terminal domain-containing protein, partial [Armatimonadota bacterium]|nr:neutral/alkaline non-lysosomal ceramidase N-terminal domain-containing protein [Armatimonadota bacterium]
MLCRLLWVFTLLLLCGVPARAGELRAGVARVDITPPVGTPLGGYAGRLGRGSTGVHDPIHAKALVLDDGVTRLAVITTDLVGTNPEMTRRVAEAAKFPPGQLLLCASHTHSGPGAYGKPLFATLTLGAYREKVFDLLATGIARALTQAIEGLQPARLAIGEVPLRGFQRNRRKTGWRDTALWLMRV